jgi:hypothetical protein
VTNIEKTWEKLIAAGARSQGEVTSIDNGPMEGMKAGYLRDPNGIIIELVEIPPNTTSFDVLGEPTEPLP